MRFICHVYLLTNMSRTIFLWILLFTVIEAKQYFEAVLNNAKKLRMRKNHTGAFHHGVLTLALILVTYL